MLLFFVLPILVASLVKEIYSVQISNETCGNTEVCFLRLEQSPTIVCNCGTQSTLCSWSTFANRGEIISNGSTEATLMWQETGYGQYICVNSTGGVPKKILILPEGLEMFR